MIRVGIGGWNFAPWRDNFYPKGLAHARELEFASRAVTSIEINSTFYRNQKPATFRKWAGETPDDFIFAVKASMFATHRRVLAEGEESVRRFLESGITELGKKLGPIVWQFAPTKIFQADDFESFLALLPRGFRHTLEVRHKSFVSAEFVALARKHDCAIVIADSEKHPLIADVTAGFLYARLQQASAKIANGYSDSALKSWQARAQTWEKGGVPRDLPLLTQEPPKKKRDVFIYMINGAKEKAPHAAMALLKRLKSQG
jgi:uncharacterized protein YecE (DUF72 family)